jgi:hypothetical protein
MQNEGFSGSKPNLISEKIFKKLDNYLIVKNNENVHNHLFKIYDDYIKPNLFAIIVIIAVAIFLAIRYIIKKYNYENEITDIPDIDANENTDEEIFFDKYKQLEHKKNNTNSIKNNTNSIKDNEIDEIDSKIDEMESQNMELIKQKNPSKKTNNHYGNYQYNDELTNDSQSFDDVQQDYQDAIIANKNHLSSEYLKQIYSNKTNKMAFNELSRIFAQGGS